MSSSGVGIGGKVSVLVLRSPRGVLAFKGSPAKDVLARGGVPVVLLRVGSVSFFFGPGGGLLSPLAYLGWGICGLWGAGSGWVGVGEGVGVSVL